jgi:hypothetical protein
MHMHAVTVLYTCTHSLLLYVVLLIHACLLNNKSAVYCSTDTCMFEYTYTIHTNHMQEQERIAVYIQGAGHVNRAMDGDVVVINMLKRDGVYIHYTVMYAYVLCIRVYL